MKISRRTFALSGMGLGALTAAPYVRALPRSGQLTILVAQPAGGVTDVFARAVAPAVGHGLGRTVVVENVAGASGSIAANRLLTAVPDGSTLFVGSPSETVLAPLTLRAVRYQPSNFRLLGVVNHSPLALYARSDLPASNLDELVALARQRTDAPMSYGSTGQGSLFHLVTEMLLSATGIQATHVPYRGGAPMLNDLQGASIDFAMLPVDALLGAMVSAGRIKVLGVSSAQRLARFPSVATFDESRAAPAFGHPSIWVGLLASATMPDSVTAELHKVVVESLGNRTVREAIAVAGGFVPLPMSLAEAAGFYAADTLKLQALARAAHIQPV